MRVDHTKNIIEVENVSFSYDGKEEILSNITLNIHQGDYVGFTGPNGAGKTTLIKLILGILVPASGSIKLFGQAIQEFKDWQKIGYVSQKAAKVDANFPATIEEVVLMGRYSTKSLLQRITVADKNLARNALERVDMWEYKDRLIGDLSGGQEQRVFIARAIVNRPEIIFLDEPMTGVDKKTQDGFYALLQKLNKNLGITIIFVSHDIERMTREVMHIACVNHTLTCHMSPEEYLKESQSENIFGQKVKIIAHHHHG